MKKISILLPYKENFSPNYAGAVSLHVKETTTASSYKKSITVYGHTYYKRKYNLKYVNLDISEKKFFSSKGKDYVNKFLSHERKNNSDIIEIHNRPIYLKNLVNKTNSKFVLYFHNDPLSMQGAKTKEERIYLFNNAEKIIFISHWIKKRFLSSLNEHIVKSSKFLVIYHSANKVNLDLNSKQNLITFVGKLNKAKGFDLFCKSVIRILKKYPNWSAVAIGDEEREQYNFKHKNLNIIGFIKHNEVLKIFSKTSIAVACSRWDEPLGRTGFEASSRGCAVIISNRGGLPETITNGIILNRLNENELYKSIKMLIENKKYRQKLQFLSNKNFHFTHKKSTSQIDLCRDSILNKNISRLNLKNTNNTNLKILHVTNFNERHNGRLFYNTGRRINNGFIRNGHGVLEFSDRDIVSYYRSLGDLNGSRRLNEKLINVTNNYVPDIIVLGHADLIKTETLLSIKKTFPHIKIAQWFLDRMDSYWEINRKRFLDKIDIVDASFCTTSPDILKLPKDKNIFYIPNPVDESFEYLSNYKNKSIYDVFFALSHGVHRGKLKVGKKDDREIFIKKLLQKTPNVKFDIYGMNNIQPIWADQFFKVLSNCKMGLNLSQGKPVKYYSSDRLAQLVGNGLLTFVDRKTMFENFFSKDEMVFYDNIDDLSEKITKYSNDDKERIKISKKGMKKYFKYFSSSKVSNFIINKTFGISTKKFFWENK